MKTHTHTYTYYNIKQKQQIPGVKSKQTAEQREFCMYGRHIMMGYMKMEDKTKVELYIGLWKYV